MNAIDRLGKKKTALLLAACLVGVVLILLAGLFLPKGDGAPKEPASLMAEIPDADLDEQPEGKAESYRRSGGGADAYWQSLEQESEQREQVRGAEPLRSDPRTSRPQAMTVDEMFGDVSSLSAAEPSDGGAASHRPTPSSGSASRKSSQKAQPSRPARQQSSALDEEYPKEEPYVEPPQVKRTGSVSSLDEDVSTNLGNGFSSLDGAEQWISGDPGKPYRCMFMRDEKVKSGQRITVRLLEDMVIGGVHVPVNTHLQGVCTISDRMEIAVTSLDMGGRILSFSYEAFDTDGGRGIYCSELNQTRKEVTEQGLATITSGLNSRLGRVARDAAGVGASIVRGKTGEATVSVPAGYTFYLVQKKQY